MHCPAVFCVGTGIFTGTVGASADKTDFRAFEFCSALYGFGAVPVRFQEKKFFEYLEKSEAWLHILRRFLFKFFKEFLNGDFFDRRSFFPFFLWFLWLILRGMLSGQEIVIIGKLETGLEIVKSAYSRSIADNKAGKDSVEMVFLEVSSPFCIGSNLELRREENGTEHIRRKPWFRAKSE